MGKTTTSYAAFKILRDKGYVKRALIIAPLRVAYNVWPTQKDEWKEFTDLKVKVLHGKDKDKNLVDLSADMYVVNPDGLPWLTGAKVVGNKIALDPNRLAYIRENFDVLIVDESTKFKSTSTNRFKIIRQFIKRFKRRYILTGMFSPNGLMDLFGQVYILDEGDSLGQWVSNYRSKYFYPADHMGYTWAPHSWAPEAIAAKIAPLCLVLDRHEHLDMPELMFNDIVVTLPVKARAQYKTMEDALVALFETEEAIIAANAAVASSKCRQICNGGLYRPDHSWEDIHDEKLDALEDLIEEMSGEPLLIAYEFNFDLEKIQKRLKIPALGQGSQAKDSELIAQFNSGILPALLGHPASISLGLNLQGSCSAICWFGLPWNLEYYSQTIDRIYRQGQKASQVIVHRLVAKDTLDEKVIRTLDAKDKSQASFLAILKGLRNAD